MERDALLAASVQPGGREPAPGGLALVQAFVNTVDREHGPDLLDRAEDFADWLDRHGGAARLGDQRLAGEPHNGASRPGGHRVAPAGEPHGGAAGVGGADLTAARELREALRGLLLANNGEPEPAGARAVLEAAGRRAGLVAAFGVSGAALVPAAGGVHGTLGGVVAAAFAAMLDGSWPRLKACPGERCGWAFYDRSTNASATWCSMRICGSRAKAGAYYRRRRVQEAAQSER